VAAIESRRLFKRFGLLVAVAALVSGIAAASAFASVNLSPAGPYASAGASVKVSGSSPFKGTTHVAVATCNVASGVEPGTRCDGPKAIPGLKTLAEYEAGSLELEVRRGPWTDWDFTKGAPVKGTTETTCKKTGEAANSQCAVVVSFYEVKGAEVKQVGAQTKNISFK
jgi:hypothetical protein